MHCSPIAHRFNNPSDLIGKVEGTLLDYNNDFSHLKQMLVYSAMHIRNDVSKLLCLLRPGTMHTLLWNHSIGYCSHTCKL